MATFSDVGKDVNDQFTKDFAKDKNVEASAKINGYLSVLLKGSVKPGKIDATFAPTIKLADYGVEIKPELSTADKSEKTYKLEVSANDAFTKGLKFELGTSNGTKGELYAGAIYKNSKFGGVTGRITAPEGKDKFISPSLYLETADTKGFGLGGTAKVVLGESAAVDTWKALLSYKPEPSFSGFFGFEKKIDEEKEKPKEGEKEKDDSEKTRSVYVVGGLLKKVENKTFGANFAYKTTDSSFDLDLLLRKNYENGTFFKVKGNLEGNVGISRQFKVQDGTSYVLGANVNVFSGKGEAGFQFSTEL